MTQQEKVQHKKRFGQFFSGDKVADKLFSLLPEGRSWKSVVDPMAGNGDMLFSVRKSSNDCPEMLGIEIDEAVAKECADRLPEAKVVYSDAFKSKELITTEGWNLVITNPPYVRYQLQNKNDNVMPSAQEIRKNLIHQIQEITYLSESEKKLFLKLARNYSGLSDMAVPSWLLCAALVKKGGYLAVVVPETWLNRDYAGPIQYLLMKLFRIETIARDANTSWFPEALVRTCLIVAKRDEMRELSAISELETRIIETDKEYTQPTVTLFPYLRSTKEATKWSEVSDKSFFTEIPELPYELAEIIGDSTAVDFVPLSEMKFGIGQGLRTGANVFFYVDMEKDDEDIILVHSNTWDRGGKTYRFNKKDIIPALQNRGEIDGLVVSSEDLSEAVIYPQDEVQDDLLTYITSAEEYKDVKGRRFKEYSAVAPNEKKNGDVVVREWYRLPKMTRRHLPNLCVTRVSSKISECLFVKQNCNSPIAIDANMVTLWNDDKKSCLELFAILNSTWCKLSLELICTVMGGGALKIEASHLKKLIIPRLQQSQLDVLAKLGNELVNETKMNDSIQDAIDRIMVSNFGNDKTVYRMKKLLTEKYKERTIR